MTKTKEQAKQKDDQNKRLSETNECVVASLFDLNLFVQHPTKLVTFFRRLLKMKAPNGCGCPWSPNNIVLETFSLTVAITKQF